MSAEPIVDVVILTWNDGELLDAAVASVVASEGIGARTIVVDNGSDPPATVDPAAGAAVLRNGSNRGVAPARNQGVRAGTSPYVCLLDSDARLTPDALAQLVQVLIDRPEVGLVAPTFVGQDPSASAGPAPTLLRKVARVLGLRDTYAAGAPFRDGERPVDFAIGACQVFRRTAFDAVGGLDESYFYGPEDVDLCLRIRLAGWQVLQLERAAVHHPPRRRHRRLFTAQGARHAHAVARHLWRHRSFHRTVAS